MDNLPTPLHQTVPGGHEIGGLKPLKPRKMPGLSNGAFLKNPVNRPDSIGADIGEKKAKGVYFNLFMSKVNFRFKSFFQCEAAGRK